MQVLRRAIFVSTALLSFSSTVFAQGVQTEAHPAVRITQKIDDASRVSLAGTHPAIVERSVVGERLAASTQLGHMRLVLSATDAQENALASLMSEQQDKTSANYHKWLTPDTFGQYFGVASSDLATLTAWLQDQGFTVESVSKSGRIISFAGTSGQVEKAFQTQMNHLTVNGESHVSNTTDLSFPAAFAGLVKGVDQLNDFYPKADAVNPHTDFIAKDNSGTTPMYTSVSSGSHYVAPGDAAVIFNSTPLLASGIDGTGVSVGVVARSDINLPDVQQFRAMFGLKKNDPTITPVGSDPGITTDDIEAFLDIEWAGAMAPGASVNFVVSGTDYFNSSGINTSGLYLVDNNLTDIITMSYGGCETSNAASGTAFWNTLWEQAAAQGQSVFVSSGDSSATGCQSSSATYGTAYGVNALGSSAYNVAVGGSMFVDGAPSTASYWAAGQGAPVPANYTFATALGYVPEAVWNEGALSTTYLNSLSTAFQTGAGISGGGGGISVCTARPAWQTGSGISSSSDTISGSTGNGTGIAAAITGCGPYTTHRLVPDMVLIAASGHDATVFCAEGSCTNTSTGYGIGAVGGTSVATPVMAGIQALINEKNGGRQGNPNFYYYPLANADYTSGAQCYTSFGGTSTVPVIGGTVTLPASKCNFHDVTAGSNRVKANSGDTTGFGFLAETGFDEASGLGSLNVNNVATNWSSVSLKASTTTFTLTPTTAAHGTSMALTVAVASTTGTPTGDVSLIATTTNPSAKLQYTLSSGAYTGTVTGLPGGSYNVHVHYEGDGTYAPSDSAAIPVTISTEASTVTSSLYYVSASSIYTAPSSVPYGVDLLLNTAITRVSGSSTVPTGTMTYSVALNGNTIGSASESLDGLGNASFQSGSGSAALLLAATTFPQLSPGAYVITASYSGDNSYAAGSTTTSFTVTAATPTVALTASAADIAFFGSVTFNYSVTRQNGTYVTPTATVAQPTGTVTFTDTTTSTVLGTAPLSSAGIATLTTTAIMAAGANSITAAYGGDANYAIASSTASVTVLAAGTSTTTAATVATAGTLYVGTSVTFTCTVSSGSGTPTGKCYYYDGATYLGSGTLSTGVTNLAASVLTAGTHTITTSYGGSSTYASSSSTTSVVINQNVTTIALDSPTYALFGTVATFNGRITRSPTTTTAPAVGLTGTVAFMDGATTIATATPVFLPGGYAYYTASSSVSTLARGQHTITAVYAGDTNYATSTSGAVTLSIGPADNVWVANGNGSVSALTGTGTAYTSSALTGGGVAIAIDNSGDIWSLNATANSVAEFTSTGAALSSGYSVGGISAPTALAIDGNGTVWITNGNNTISAVSQAGAAVSPSGGYAVTTTAPTSINVDSAGNLWITSSGDNSVTEVIGAGAPVTTPMTTSVSNGTVAARP
jgi:hypothetical protein